MMGSIAGLESALHQRLEGEVRFDRSAKALYATDASNYRQIPLGIVIPRHQGDVENALELARENSIPVLARGGGTSLAGQACNAALVIDFSKYMNAIRAVDSDARIAIVEPGVVPAMLNASLAPQGLFFAPDPTTKDRCNIGGMIGNNSCGAHSLAWGKTVDNLAGLSVLLYDGTRLELGASQDPPATRRTTELFGALRELARRYGELIRQRYPRIPRRVSGYNLDQLLPENGFNVARALVGSEGTLAVTLEARVHLAPLAKRRALAVLGFRDVFEAADQTPWILEHRPQALEGFDGRLMEFVRKSGLGADLLHLLPSAGGYLMAEFAADDDSAEGKAQALAEHARRGASCTDARVYSDEACQRQVWQLRESGLGAGALIKGYPRTWPGAEDAAVAPERLGSFLRGFAKLIERNSLEVASYYGHFGDGCVHTRINFDFMTAGGIARFRRAMEEFADLVIEHGGSLSGEHGDGLARSELLPRMFGPELIGAFREFKRIFDPDFRMNPGVIVDPHPIDDQLRVSGYRPVAAASHTHFDFSADGGLAGAALRCVGIGKCRKLDAGTMCPSYMATMEEKHSTRGRAHLLYEALAGGPLGAGFADPAVYEALDLCLACKGCKRECPAAVDMAAYKAEFLAHYYEMHRRPLHGEFFGRIHQFARIGSALPRLANAMAQPPVMSRLARRMLGVHPRRPFPRLAPRTFRAWFARRRPATTGKRRVILFADTFHNYFEPAVPVAAVEVLERAGFAVVVPPTDLCCGRPMYDQGMLTEAKRGLARIMDVLDPYLRDGVSVVGLEPSCILTFRDELLALFPGDARASSLAANSSLFAEFLEREAPGFIPSALPGKALLHAHCHHKAIASAKSDAALLRRIEGLEVTELDAGCCGMAGAFGYAADHYEISCQIAGRRLVPAITGATADTLLISDGFSCRSQIAHLCPGRRPLHIAQVLNRRNGTAAD